MKALFTRIRGGWLVTLFGLSALFGVSGCNTTAGIGEDVEAAGEAIEREAEESRGY